MAELPTLTTGQRIKLYRTRAGKSRPVLAGLVGRSAEWVKAVETGKIHPPRLGMLNHIAKSLGVPVAELLDSDQVPSANLSGPKLPLLDQVREALNHSIPAGPVSLAELRSALDAGWTLRNSADDHRSRLGELVARLLPVAAATVREQETRAERLRACAMLSEVAGLAQNFAAHQSGAADVVWRLVDRNLSAGYDSCALTPLGISVHWAALAHRESGSWDVAQGLLDRTISEIENHLPDAPDELLAVYGALHAETAVVSARAGEGGRALRHLDVAAQVGRRLPRDYFHSPTSFGASDLPVLATIVEVELRKPASALRVAGRINDHPSRPRLGRHLVDVARAHHQRGNLDGAVAALRRARRVSPQAVAYNPHARGIALDLAGRKIRKDVVREVAALTGIAAQ